MATTRLAQQHCIPRCSHHHLAGLGLAHLNASRPHRQAAHPPASLPPGKTAPGAAAPLVNVLDRTPAPPQPATSQPPTPALPAGTSAAPTATAALPDQTSGLLSLSLVPIVWGTYNPCIRYLYAEADPLDPASLTAVRTLLSASALLLPALLGYLYRAGRDAWSRRGAQEALRGGADGTGRSSSVSAAEGEAGLAGQHRVTLGETLAAASDGAADGVAAAAAPDADEPEVRAVGGGDRSLFSPPINSARLGPVLTRTFDSVVLGGLELGLLNFLGTALQVEGLHSTSATRAGFLAEVTAVLTPFVSYLAGYDIPRQMWVAVAIGLVGSTMVAYDTSQARDSPGTTTETAGTPTAVGPASPVLPPAAATATAAGTAAAAAPGPTQDTPDGPAPATAAEAALAFEPPAPEPAPTASTSDAPGGVAPWDSATASAAAGPGLASDPADLTLAAVAEPMPVLQQGGSVVAEAFSSGATDGLTAAAEAATTLGAADPDLGASTVAAIASAVGALPGGTGDAAAQAAADVTAGAATAAAGVAASAAAATAAAAAGTVLDITGGEGYLLLACLFYSVCTVRMGIYSPRMDTVSLAAMKKVGLSSMSVLWMAATNLQNGAGLGSVFTFPDLSTRTPLSLAVLLYSGLGPGALATFLQVTGLSTVPATTAQVIFSMTPLCTAFFAYLILGGETTGPVAWTGGVIIILAALMAANAQHQQHKQQQQRAQLSSGPTSEEVN